MHVKSTWLCNCTLILVWMPAGPLQDRSLTRAICQLATARFTKVPLSCHNSSSRERACRQSEAWEALLTFSPLPCGNWIIFDQGLISALVAPVWRLHGDDYQRTIHSRPIRFQRSWNQDSVCFQKSCLPLFFSSVIQMTIFTKHLQFTLCFGVAIQTNSTLFSDPSLASVSMAHHGFFLHPTPVRKLDCSQERTARNPMSSALQQGSGSKAPKTMEPQKLFHR